MPIKALIPGALVAALLLFGGLPAGAQDKQPVLTLQPMENSDLPAGSQISEERLQETQSKIQELKANLKAQQLRKQQQQQQQEAQPEGEQQ